jgi:hypothetical protein
MIILAEYSDGEHTMRVGFIDSGREPQCPSNPDFPDGTEVDMSHGAAKTCDVSLPYPAPRCGVLVMDCSKCGLRVGVTVAGRRDDPRIAKLACKLN